MKNIYTVIIAAGKGTRMKSESSKLLQKIYGKEMILRVVETAKKVGSSEVITVVGYKKEEVMKSLEKENVKFAVQEEQLGTGHAVMMAKDELKDKKGVVVVLSGDVPIIRKETIEGLINKNIQNDESATILTAVYNNPFGYGRIIRDEKGNVKRIVEEKDANDEEKLVKEINGGIYVFDLEKLLVALDEITPSNAQNEYYLTDVITIFNKKGYKIGAFTVEDNTEILGVNDRVQLELIAKILRKRINTEHMKNGVTFEDANTAYIYDDVEIGMDTIIEPMVTIKSGAKIGKNVHIGQGSYISENEKIKDNSVLPNGYIKK